LFEAFGNLVNASGAFMAENWAPSRIFWHKEWHILNAMLILTYTILLFPFWVRFEATGIAAVGAQTLLTVRPKVGINIFWACALEDPFILFVFHSDTWLKLSVGMKI
jgi:hypothetical protein